MQGLFFNGDQLFVASTKLGNKWVDGVFEVKVVCALLSVVAVKLSSCCDLSCIKNTVMLN
jgi:hypothetical protein